MVTTSIVMYLFFFHSGQAGDKAAAAALGSLLCIQLGASSSLHVYQTLKPLLITVMNDPSQAMAARSSVSV